MHLLPFSLSFFRTQHKFINIFSTYMRFKPAIVLIAISCTSTKVFKYATALIFHLVLMVCVFSQPIFSLGWPEGNLTRKFLLLLLLMLFLLKQERITFDRGDTLRILLALFLIVTTKMFKYWIKYQSQDFLNILSPYCHFQHVNIPSTHHQLILNSAKDKK